MPILKKDDGTTEVIKCLWYCQKWADKTCHEKACRLNQNRKNTEFDIKVRIEWQKVLDEIEKSLY